MHAKEHPVESIQSSSICVPLEYVIFDMSTSALGKWTHKIFVAGQKISR